MGRYLIQRVLSIIPTLLAMTLITFAVMHAIPGSPFDPSTRGGNDLPPEVIARIEASYGLDRPLPLQYLSFIGGALRGDFGYSFASRSRTVAELLGETFPISLHLGLMAFALALALGIPLGILAAARQGGMVDHLVRLLTMLGIAMPSFVISVLLILLFALVLRVLPAASVHWEDPRAWLLPTASLALGPLAIFARYTRAAMLDELSSDYVRTARAKGLRESSILYGHVLKAALMPVITVAGPIFASIATGSFLVETIFSVPGMGRFFVSSIFAKDYPVIMALVLIYGMFLAFSNLVVDALYTVADPRAQGAIFSAKGGA
ncbi:ABC transporter permease [Chloroflexia bacterium SDU3-3]|nr:ABC transporter permease [Chloroflexia bacterium SDU3-3]